MECDSCAAFIPSSQSTCPSHDRAVRSKLFQQLGSPAWYDIERRTEAREQRLNSLAAARDTGDVDNLHISLPPGGDLNLRGLLQHLRIPRFLFGAAPSATRSLRQRMEDWDLDPTMTLVELLSLVEEFGAGVDLWTSPKRAEATKRQRQLYALSGCSLQRMAVAEAPTSWSAVAVAVVSAFEDGRMMQE